MDDKALLELAAKAIGRDVAMWDRIVEPHVPYLETDDPVSLGTRWDPLADDGDAMRLAGSLGLYVDFHQPSHRVMVAWGDNKGVQWTIEEYGNDKQAAARRAIVRAAAQIGRLKEAA